MSAEPRNPMQRRTFLKLAGLTGAGALAGCAQGPAEHVFSYVSPPEDERLGIATWYASTCRECPAACGVLVRTREGRALKLEGNPAHPLNQGRLCVRGQAAVQGLYHPDRVPGPQGREGEEWADRTWEEAEAALVEALRGAAGTPGAIQFWTGASTGAWSDFVDEWCRATGAERVVYEPFDYGPVREASRRAFGSSTIPRFDLGEARYVLSLGADFLDGWGLPLAQARGYDRFHSAKGGVLGKHVQVEPRLSLTGHSADQWIGIRPGTEAIFALGLARLLGSAPEGPTAAEAAEACGVPEETLSRLAEELRQHTPALVLGPGVANGGTNATDAWAAAFVLNRALGGLGTTVHPAPGFDPGPIATFAEVRDAVARLASGEVRVLLVHETNPAYSLGALDFEAAAAMAGFRASLSTQRDETSELSQWLLPDPHAIESWGDAEPVAGVRSLQQPAMRPVFRTRPAAEVLMGAARALGGSTASAFPEESFREYVRRRWGGDEAAWRSALQAGGRLPETIPAGGVPGGGGVAPAARPAVLGGDGDLALVAFPHPFHYDGRGANKSWLQEIPDPIMRVVWDSWCELHPETASGLGVGTGDVVTLATEVGSIEVPVLENPMMATGVAAVPIGQGHTSYGRYAEGRGVNVFTILPAATDADSGGRAYLCTRVRVSPAGRTHRLVLSTETRTQPHESIAKAIPLTLVAAGASANGHGTNGHGANGHGANGNGAGGADEHAGGAPEPGHPPQEHGAGSHSMEHGRVFHNYREYDEQLDGLHAEPLPESAIPAAGYNQYNRTRKRWGMAIDLSSCIGCSACVAACYAENNIAIVGKENIVRGREMAWIRIERYYEETPGGIEARFAPMLCQHCENAPCETVCPVYATYHNPEGLNVQVYNRCVGTRYCSNNCPYKVRAFNWFEYEAWPSPLHWQLNPDVTVRSKGVMEKCTFCVQRIRNARSTARDENRDVRDGEIVPACAQTCPTNAIAFGDMHDPQSEVARRASSERGYHVLGELNTQPGITYLKKVSRRTSPEASSGADHGEA